MTFASLAGYVMLGVSLIIFLYGGWAIFGKIAWYASWKWGTARQRYRSVRLGWNAGEPPEGQWVLVREHTKFSKGVKTAQKRDWDWAVMRRHGNMMTSTSGGLSMPIENCTGWLYITEEPPMVEQKSPADMTNAELGIHGHRIHD